MLVDSVTPTQIFLSYGPELLYTILNVNPKSIFFYKKAYYSTYSTLHIVL